MVKKLKSQIFINFHFAKLQKKPPQTGRLIDN